MNTPRSSIKHQIVFSFIVLLGIIFGISSYFVYVNWLGSVEQATQKILENVGDRVYRQIDRFVDVPLGINNHNVLPIRRKLVDLADDKSRDLFFANQIKTSPLDVYSFTYGTENGHFFWRPSQSAKRDRDLQKQCGIGWEKPLLQNKS